MIDLLNKICPMVDLANLVIIGDFNLKHIDWTLLSPIGKSPNSYEQQIINCSLDHYLSQHCFEPTRVRAGNESSLLDLIFVKDESIIHSLDYEAPLGKSDHVLISLTLSTMLSRNKPTTEHFRFNLGDYTGMRSQLQEIDWATALEGKSLQEMWEYLSFLIGTLTEQYIPKSKYGSNQRPMWMNTSASDEVKKKKRAFNKYRYVPTRGNLDQYVAQNKIANKATFKAKKSFELKVASQIKKHPKSFWKYVRSKTNSPQTISDLVENGTTHSDDKSKAVCLNEYFSSVFLRDSNITADIQTDNQSNDSTNTDEPNLSTIIITKELIAKKLQNLKPDKAAGPDNIFPRILIECQYELLTPLYLLFKESLKTGKIPQQWKDATVVAIFKKGSKRLASNYRPISLTCIICKILESIIRDQMLEFFMQNNKISDKQFGFLPGRSCTLQLLYCVHKWINELENDHTVAIFYTDFRKAFDSVSHCKLIRRLEMLGIAGMLLTWVVSFLTERKQRVRVGDMFSDFCDVLSGVPQGSVLGPLLFLGYIDNIVQHPSNSEMVLFADDAKMFLNVESNYDIECFQKDIESVCDWAIDWSLSFNAKKCKILQLGTNAIDHIFEMKDGIARSNIEYVTEEKDLGILIDSKLKFRAHVGTVVSKANQMLGIIKRSFDNMGEFAFLNLYKSLVRPHLEYGNVIWSPATVNEIILIEGVQRRATAMIKKCKGLSYEERLRKLGIPTLEYRRHRADLIQVYRLFSGIDRMDANVFFSLHNEDEPGSVRAETRGHPRKLSKNRYVRRLGRDSFAFRVVNPWNKLPLDVVMAPNLNSFKSRLNVHYKNFPLKFCPSFMSAR